MDLNGQPLQGKKLLLLDGSKKAIEIIDHAHRLGLYVVVTDYNSPEQSPAKMVADEYFDVSSSDVEAVTELIQREGISGVMTGFSDRWLPRFAEICEAAGLPCYASPDQLRLFTDKKRYKKLLEDYDIPTIQGFTTDEAESGSIPTSSFPVMVKPADGSGSRGITVCHSQEELQEGLRVAREYSWTDDLVIERYMPGEEATVFWVFQDGEYHVAMIWNRHMVTFGDGAYRLPFGYTTPSYLVPDYLSGVAPQVRKMLAAAEIHDGIMFMQGIVDNGVFRTYDIGYRVTPTQEYRIIEELCGYNPLMMLIHYSVTGTMGEPDLANKANAQHSRYGLNISTLIRPGHVAAYQGLEKVRSSPGVLSSATSLAEGETLPEEAWGQLRQIAVRTTAVANTFEDLLDTAETIDHDIDVRDISGSSLRLGSMPLPSLDEVLLAPDEEGV